jgi:hypothetical protein
MRMPTCMNEATSQLEAPRSNHNFVPARWSKQCPDTKSGKQSRQHHALLHIGSGTVLES